MWTAKWIWQSEDGPVNTWMCFRKTFNLDKDPKSVAAKIAVDSKYWMWINGKLSVFEGSLKRGPTPVDTYYDLVDIKEYLKKGDNTITVLVWYWGAKGFRGCSSHNDSGKGGFLLEAEIDNIRIISDSKWKMKVHPSYCHEPEQDQNWRLPEYNIKYDARNDIAIGNWLEESYDDSTWDIPVEKGVPPVEPWHNLWERPIPLWKDSGLVSYTNEKDFHMYTDGSVITAKLPYNAQITPYLKVDAPEGCTIGISTDNIVGCPWQGKILNNISSEYITKAGIQEFESLGWMNGHEIRYAIPPGVRILELKYRETGYNTEFSGSFRCNDSFYNTLWEKAARTVYVCMRDTYMDCPDRERTQWVGDAVNEMWQTFYAFDTNVHALTRKEISNIVEWKRENDALLCDIPSSGGFETPMQELAAVGMYGFWAYYMYTDDAETIINAYPQVRDYLKIWEFDEDGLIRHREGDFYWADFDEEDYKLPDNVWYYLALKAAINMANLAGNTQDIAEFEKRKRKIELNFDRALWNGNGYKTPGFNGELSERGNALAVVAGLADKSKWPAIREILRSNSNIGAFSERFILEAYYIMGYPQDALDRIKSKYGPMVNDPVYSTLWELLWNQWDIKKGSYNHGWTGGPLILLSQYAAGVAPETAGFDTYHVFPQEGNLTSVQMLVPSVRGNIVVRISKSVDRYDLILTSPANTTAVVGIPRGASNPINTIKVGSTTVWSKGSFFGTMPAGITPYGEDDRYVKFYMSPGTNTFSAYL